MNLESMLDQCMAEGVSISLEGGKLVITGQQAALDEWRPLLRSLRSELLEMMVRSAVIAQQRTTAFLARGVDSMTAHALSLRLKTRDSEHDERSLCLECNHLAGTPDLRRCAQWKHAGLGSPQIPRDLPFILQRCKGFRLANTNLESSPRHSNLRPYQ